jgi:hypothetical protein
MKEGIVSRVAIDCVLPTAGFCAVPDDRVHPGSRRAVLAGFGGQEVPATIVSWAEVWYVIDNTTSLQIAW